VFGVLVDAVRVVEVTPVDLALDLARCYVSCIPQAKRHARWRSIGHMRALSAFANLDRVGEHAFDAIKPRDQVARSGWVGFR
jgi:hypothetical protein